MTLHSYSKVYSLGHRITKDLLTPGDNIVIQEKIDGSQFSFGVTEDGEVLCRSRGQQIDVNEPNNLFAPAVATVVSLKDKLHKGWVYRAEALCKPKHNTLCYDRIPFGGLIVYDIETDLQMEFLAPWAVVSATKALGLECVPCFNDAIPEGGVPTLEDLRALTDQPSILGQKMEGIVIKNYDKFAPEGKVLMGKIVRDDFKEMHGPDWKKRNPSGPDIRQNIGEMFAVPARFEKAVQRLRDAGLLDESPTDIGPLLKDLNKDLLEEQADFIKEQLFQWAWKHICKQSTKGFPEWYKKKLLVSQFPEEREEAS